MNYRLYRWNRNLPGGNSRAMGEQGGLTLICSVTLCSTFMCLFIVSAALRLRGSGGLFVLVPIKGMLRMLCVYFI